MLLMMYRHNLGKAFDFSSHRAARDQDVVDRQQTLPCCGDRAGNFGWKTAQTHREVSDPHAGEPCFLNQPRK